MYRVGIDLGTTHSALAFARVRDGGGPAPVEDFPVPQWVRPGERESRPLLPSFVFLPPSPGELPPSPGQPSSGGIERVVGELARWQGARIPGRVIASAKSWLCHPGVDRQAAILPWGAAADVPRLSPVDASAAILAHLRDAWDAAHPEAPLRAQEVVLTVPASFDEAARALTVSAARQVGLERFVLLEEPQAAFYDFTAQQGPALARALQGVRLVLVVDVGGGTTDFTLVHAAMSAEGPLLKRVAVGDHLLLGGDNMDAALAHAAETGSAQPSRLPPAQWQLLVQAARAAKESLLGAAPPERERLSVAGEGSRLLGNSWSAELTRAQAEETVLDGFFPRVAATDRPSQSSGRLALQAVGLPFTPDAAVTRHLVAFLAAHADAGFQALGRPRVPDALPRPDALLLNGGVFNSPRIVERLVDGVSALFPGQPPIPLLPHGSLDRAVARGAAHYAQVRHGLGLKIGGGAARAFYLGVRSPGPEQALCLLPRGMEAGTSVRLERPFTLTLGEPVQFPLFSSTADRVDKPGELVSPDEAFHRLPPLHAVLTRASGERGAVEVRVEAGLTEIGTLELACVSSGTQAERWRLEFELRGASEGGAARAPAAVESMPARFEEAREWVDRIFGHKPIAGNPRDVKQLFRSLERVLGPREGWRVPVLRELWGALFSGASKRRRSPDHERVFFQLLGFTLRPGLGYPLDGWRAEQTFTLFRDSVQFHGEKPGWVEFWVMWRRVAGGLDAEAHGQLWGYLRPQLKQRLLPQESAPARPKGVQPEGLEEMVRTAAALEHLPPEAKTELGEWITARLREPTTAGGPWTWALGRLGARVPLFGSSHQIVPPGTAEAWLRLLLDRGLQTLDGAPFAVTQMARLTGDRTRDLDPALRERARDALRALRAPERWVQLLEQASAFDAQDEARALGDTLPAGLSLA